MKWILISFLAWVPHEKEVLALLRKAERTPEMKMKQDTLIEKLSNDRSFILTKIDCNVLKEQAEQSPESHTQQCF